MQLVPFCVHAGSAYKFQNFIEDFTLTLPCCHSVIQFCKVPKQIYNVGKYGRNPWAKWYCKGGCKFQVQCRVGAIAASAMMPGIQVFYCPGKAGCTCDFAWALCVFHQFWSTIHCVSVVSVVTTCYSHWNAFFSFNLKILKLKVKLNQTISPNLNTMGLGPVSLTEFYSQFKYDKNFNML